MSSALTSWRTGPRAATLAGRSAPCLDFPLVHHIMHSPRCDCLPFVTSCERLGVTALLPQEDGYDPYRLPYWIRASFIMEERWGELEAEFNAGKAAMQLAEDWGVVSIPPPPAVHTVHVRIPAVA